MPGQRCPAHSTSYFAIELQIHALTKKETSWRISAQNEVIIEGYLITTFRAGGVYMAMH